jgi:hypothetical protein
MTFSTSMHQGFGKWLPALAYALLLSGCDKAPSSDTGGETGETGENSETGETGDEMPDPYAVAECEAMFACGCEQRPFASLEDCVAIRTEQLAALAVVAEQRGLTWDPECAQARVDRLTAACDVSFALHPHETCTGGWCPLYVGEKAVGAECDLLGSAELVSDCGQGAICTLPNARCEEYCHVLEDGENCQGSQFGDGYLGEHCRLDLNCITTDGDSWSCGPPLGAGDACVDLPLEFGPPSCGAGLICDGSICQNEPGAGAPCVLGKCAEGAYCDVDTCVEAKPNGEACNADLECQAGLCLDSICADPPDQVGESCLEEGVCADGLWCDLQQDETGQNFEGTCRMPETHACTIATNGCAVEYNGVCEDETFNQSGPCEADEDHYDCGHCEYAGGGPGICGEDSGLCPPGSDPDDC